MGVAVVSHEQGKKGAEIAGGHISGEITQASLAELCERGLLTCTSGEPGEPGSTYAVAWLPLDNPEQYPEEVRERHDRNMAAFNDTR